MKRIRDVPYRRVLSPASHSFHNTGIAYLRLNTIYSIYVYQYPTDTIRWLNADQPMKILYKQGGILSFSLSAYQTTLLSQTIVILL